jgi:ubiquinone/menaquinone biosynthesis C-methylase UbiE
MEQSHHPHSYQAANKHHFDGAAHNYDSRQDTQELARRLGQAMLECCPFDEETTTVMDYACGTGTHFTISSGADAAIDIWQV